MLQETLEYHCLGKRPNLRNLKILHLYKLFKGNRGNGNKIVGMETNKLSVLSKLASKEIKKKIKKKITRLTILLELKA